MGTLLDIEPPGSLLAAQLAAAGVAVTTQQAEYAFGAEIAYYREHHLEGSDGPSLAALRERCAAMLHSALPADARTQITIPSLRKAMLASLRFIAMPYAHETLMTLRSAGMQLIVVSNWDISLEQALERAQLRSDLDAVVTSAAVGFAKPDEEIFRRALTLAGVGGAEAVHVGDSRRLDVAGARNAGIQPVLLSATPMHGVPTISSLSQLPSLLASLTASWQRPDRQHPDRPASPPSPSRAPLHDAWAERPAARQADE